MLRSATRGPSIVAPDQRALPLTPPAPCRRCGGTGDVYYLPGRREVIGGKRVVCPECGGSGVVPPVHAMEIRVDDV